MWHTGREKAVNRVEQEETIIHTCIICDQPKPEGILICSEFICEECEAEMVKTDVLDAKYPFFIHRMNKIWYRMNA
ncbi:sigma factor G inhibitor Gin [Paenibacillus hodogayensis]|uniref:Sigma factor G inhibitor Gin n=1 Tax=Paenibacillus hodogayensis TaxID=279208 RepID=A0ABV5W5L7_9BACL